MLNKVVLMGRLTADIEVRVTENEKKVSNFILAVERNFPNSNGERETDFISCKAWNSKAEFLSKWFGKGSSVIICGSLHISHYEKDGEKRSYPFVLADEIYFTGEKRKNDDVSADEKADENENDYTDFMNIDFEGMPF